MGELYSPTPPPPPAPPPPAADDCATQPGLTLKNLVDIDLGLDGAAGGGLLPNAQLLRLEAGDTSVAIGNPLAPECADQQTGALIGVNVSELPFSGPCEAGATGDLLHVAVDDATVKVGNPFGSGGEDTPPLIDVNAQNLPLIASSGPGDDGGGTLLAGLLGTGSDMAGSASGLLSGLLASRDTGGGDGGDCGCGGILQPVLDLALDPMDGLLG